MGYPVDKKAQIHSELALLTPRLTAFAAALTGSEAATHSLLKSTRSQVLSRAAKERGHTPLIIWSFALMHGLWASRTKSTGGGERHAPADPRLFQTRSSVQGGDPQGAGRMARFIAQLTPQQRATLHLVYGERLSYDEVAEIFSVPVGTVMTRLARAHAALAERNDNGVPANHLAAGTLKHAQEGPRGREWAA
jgi:RNA polymerase sigma-70 factor, ECF subfamily